MECYPIVFVHGFNNMGETFAPAATYLNSLGYEAYAPHIAPFTSAWDRACDLYAMLFGGTADYGKAHAKKGKHKRNGLHYDGILPDLGQPGAHEKVNLIGHSFGGETIRVLLHLLAYGDEKERAVTKEKDLSPLFRGGQEGLINCIYCLASPLNGTTLCTDLDRMTRLLSFGQLKKANKLSGSKDPYAAVMLMDQFGFTSAEKKHIYKPISILKFLFSKDSCYGDLSLRGAAKWNAILDTVDSVYYFSQPADISVKKGLLTVPAAGVLDRYKISVFFMGLVHARQGKAWAASDGRVNTISETAPFDEPQVDYTDSMTLQKGIWHVMPTQAVNHTFYEGEEVPTEEFEAFYRNLGALLERISDTE